MPRESAMSRRLLSIENLFWFTCCANAHASTLPTTANTLTRLSAAAAMIASDSDRDSTRCDAGAEQSDALSHGGKETATDKAAGRHRHDPSHPPQSPKVHASRARHAWRRIRRPMEKVLRRFCCVVARATAGVGGTQRRFGASVDGFDRACRSSVRSTQAEGPSQRTGSTKSRSSNSVCGSVVEGEVGDDDDNDEFEEVELVRTFDEGCIELELELDSSRLDTWTSRSKACPSWRGKAETASQCAAHELASRRWPL